MTKANRTIHLAIFTPYSSPHSLLNDPITHLKLRALKKFVPPGATRRHDVKAHIFGSGDSLSSFYYEKLGDGHTSDRALKVAKEVILRMEEGRHYPLIPCPYACEFKQRCNPVEFK